MNTPNPVHWFEIYVDDMPRAKTFYEAVFQTTLSRIESPINLWGFPLAKDKGGASGALVQMDGFSAGRNSVIIYFGCRDCSVEAARALENGGTIQREKFAIGPHGFISLVIDTEGNIIGLHSME